MCLDALALRQLLVDPCTGRSPRSCHGQVKLVADLDSATLSRCAVWLAYLWRQQQQPGRGRRSPHRRPLRLLPHLGRQLLGSQVFPLPLLPPCAHC